MAGTKLIAHGAGFDLAGRQRGDRHRVCLEPLPLELLVPASSSPMTFLIRDLISGKYEEPLLEGNQDEAVRADGSAGDGMNARLPRETSIRSCKLRAR